MVVKVCSPYLPPKVCSPYTRPSRDGQTSPHRPRLVVSRSSPPITPPHTHKQLCTRSTVCSTNNLFFISARRNRDPTVPVTQCNGLCHVTLSHTHPGRAKTATSHRAPQTHSKKVSNKELKTHITHQSRERTTPNSTQTCHIHLDK